MLKVPGPSSWVALHLVGRHQGCLARCTNKSLLTSRASCIQQSKSHAAFASKISFGDVDLLASLPQRAFDPLTDLGSTASLQNENIRHLHHRYQVDLIHVNDTLLELAQFCYDYGDTGMIMGMFLRNLGLKFGQGGLKYTCGTYKWSLSQDLKAILQFLGLDYDFWKQACFRV